MRELDSLTKKECIEIGNRAFRRHINKEPYQSKNWKLHLYLDANGKCTEVAIVDEKKPVEHVDDLYTKDTRIIQTSNDLPHHPMPLYNMVRLRYEMVSKATRVGIIIQTETVFSYEFDDLLTERSQDWIFNYLDQIGMNGEKITFD